MEKLHINKIKNYTKHPVTVFFKNKMVTFMPENKPLRCEYENEFLALMVTSNNEEVPLTHINYKSPELPLEEPGVFLIVSKIVAELNPNRKDLLLPGGITYENGSAKGCKSLVRLRKH